VLRELGAHARRHSIGYVALFVALGGSAYAAATVGSADIQNDAVLSRHLNDGAVQRADIGPSSVGSGKVVDNSLTGKDIDEGKLGRVNEAEHAVSADSIAGVCALTLPGPIFSAGCKQGSGTIVVNSKPGVYCIHLPFSAHSATVTIDSAKGPSAVGFASLNPAYIQTRCSPELTNVVVTTYNKAGGVPTNEPFHAIFA
jgi:hypothetical protein